MVKKGKEKLAIFILNPKAATTQAVNVVPKFAPKITLREFLKLIIPPPKNASTNRVTIELLCNMAVTTVPVIIPCQLFSEALNKVLKRFPCKSFHPIPLKTSSNQTRLLS